VVCVVENLVAFSSIALLSAGKEKEKEKRVVDEQVKYTTSILVYRQEQREIRHSRERRQSESERAD
jgi:hypothetical protein